MAFHEARPHHRDREASISGIERHVAWQICSDPGEAQGFLHGNSALRDFLEKAEPNSKLLGADLAGLIELADAVDQRIARCVLFGQHPGGFEMSDATIETGEAAVKQTDYNRSLWLAITDPVFRESCFGNARETLQRYGLNLSDEELGKFRWFDSEKLANFSLQLDDSIDQLATIGADEDRETSERGDAGQDPYQRAYAEYARQVERIRERAGELAATESWLDPEEFDPGPPAHDFPTFMRVLNSWRLYGSDLDQICADTGLLVGRITPILKIATRMEIELPDHPGRNTLSAADATRFVEAVFRHRPPLNEVHHQSPCCPTAVLDRVNKIAASEWLHGKSVAVLGDDDGISVALAAFTDVESVTVIDIDPEVIAFLESLAAEMGVEIEIRLHDLRKPLPDDLKGRFWLVNADPPQNAKGERFFLEQAFTLLQPELGHRVYCSITPFWMGFERYHEIMGFLLSRGFVSVDVHTDIMAFPVSAPTMASSYKHAKSRHFVETALGSLTNMVCDIHVLHRAKHS